MTESASGRWTDLRDALVEVAPMLRRAVDLDPASLARIRHATATAVFANLPFGVLVARTVRSAADRPPFDTTALARELLGWLDGERAAAPAPRDADWRGGLPPDTGWRRVDTVPDGVVRDLVRKGASALQDAARREGLPGAQPRSDVADALLDSVVLTVTADTAADRAEVTLRTLGALTRMGFLSRESHAHIDVSGRWTRVAATYGSAYAQAAGGLAISAR